MSSPPTDPEHPLGRLYSEGYDLIIRNGHLIVRQIPYLGPSGLHRDGKLVLPVNDSGPAIVDAIGDHTIWFAGEEPRDERGVALGGPHHHDLGDGESVDFRLSFKPPSGSYSSLYEKVAHYARILRDAAAHQDAGVTVTPGA